MSDTTNFFDNKKRSKHITIPSGEFTATSSFNGLAQRYNYKGQSHNG